MKGILQRLCFLLPATAFFATAILVHGDTNAPASQPVASQVQAISTNAAGISAQSQALINQTQSLSASGVTLLNDQLADIVKGVVTAAKDGNGQIVEHAITQQYLQTASGLIQQYDPSSSVDKAILDDFDYYSIIAIDRVIVDKGVAFVEARIVYLPTKLADIVQDEAEAAKDAAQGQTQQQSKSSPQQVGGTLWTNFGGSASAAKCEKGGVGRVTYYLALQKGFWKLHYCYFSLDPLTDSELATVTAKMKTLIQ